MRKSSPALSLANARFGANAHGQQRICDSLTLTQPLRYAQGFAYPQTVRRKPMPYQYKREPLNNNEVDKLTNTCNIFREKFVVWTFLDTGWYDINKR